jgi:protein O-mannosyl-transferase
VLVVVLASYLPVLGAPFVWDDQHLIERTPLVQTLQPLPEYFKQGFWQGDDLAQGRIYYRPLTVLSLALDRALHGNSPAGFHLTNLLVHLSSSALLFWLLRARGSGGAVAALGTALWALHPRLTEAVAWVSGRTDVLATFFVLCALLSQNRGSRASRISCAWFLLFGLMCKEVALAGVAAVLVAEFASGGPLRARLWRMLPTFLALGAYSLLRQNATDVLQNKASSLSSHFVPGSAAVGHYLVMLLTPWFPNLQIGRLSQPSTGYVLLGCAVLLAAAYWLVRRGARLRREQLPPLTLFVVALVLVLHIAKLSLIVVAADRFLYLPLVGLVLLLAPRGEAWSPLATVGCTVLAGSFAVATFVRSNTWSDEVQLWTETYEANPENRSAACSELGRLYARAGLLAHAYSVDEGCADTSYNRRVLLNNAASVLARAGRFEAAIRRIWGLRPELGGEPVFGLNLALFRTYLADFPGARAELAHTLAVDPDYAEARALLEKLPELERERRGVEALPSDAPAEQRAKSLAKLGLTVPALNAWRQSLAAPGASREQFEEALWFALAHGDPSTVADFYRQYRLRYGSVGDPQLQVAYEAAEELVRRLLGAWPRLGLPLRSLPS